LLRTVEVRTRGIQAKSALRLVAPTEVNRTVAPTRRPNAELRTREHLTPGEVEALIEAAKANRYGHRAAGRLSTFSWRARALRLAAGVADRLWEIRDIAGVLDAFENQTPGLILTRKREPG
jgi:hypothetical protein